MDLKSLRKPDLLLMCKELGVETGRAVRKPQLINAILALKADDDELNECWELIKEREKKEEEEKCRADDEKRRADEINCREQDLEMKRLDVDMKKAEARLAAPQSTSGGDEGIIKIKDLMQPFHLGEDIGLFLVNFERTCKKRELTRGSWPQHLLPLLPCQVADVIARLSKEDSQNYDTIKASLLKRYRLSPEAFRQRFRKETESINGGGVPRIRVQSKDKLCGVAEKRRRLW